MEKMTLDKIIVVKRATQLEELLKRHATASQVKFYLESQGKSYKDYLAEHTAYHEGLKQTKKAIPKTIRQKEVDKEYLASFHFGEKDLVVVVGDDGLVVNVAKYVGEQPVVSVNPDEKR
ncbi:MAG: NAD(+)/NADH kinase, partial [Nanoarchaeota archaeon]|nr:NAD(+)/NADH kinase [Nanoarchaeota archaeon]